MALDARLLAAQGFGFPLSPIALAVQGFLGTEPADPPVAEQPRAAIIGRGPGTTLNLSTYLQRLKRGHVLPAMPVHTPARQQRKRAIKRRQRREEEVIALLTDF